MVRWIKEVRDALFELFFSWGWDDANSSINIQLVRDVWSSLGSLRPFESKFLLSEDVYNNKLEGKAGAGGPPDLHETNEKLTFSPSGPPGDPRPPHKIAPRGA